MKIIYKQMMEPVYMALNANQSIKLVPLIIKVIIMMVGEVFVRVKNFLDNLVIIFGFYLLY